MDRRTLLFVVISVLIIVLYQEVVIKRVLPPQPEGMPAIATDEPAVLPPGAPAEERVPSQAAVTEREFAEERAAPPLEGERIAVETDLYRAVLSTGGGRLESLSLKRYRQTEAPDSPPLALVSPDPEIEPPLGFELRGARVWSDARTPYTADRNELSLHGGETATLVLRGDVDGKPITKSFTFRGDAYPIDLEVTAPAGADLPAELTADGPAGEAASVALVLARRVPRESSSTSFEGATSLIDGKLVHRSLADLEKPEVLAGEVAWSGFEDHYFLTAAAPDGARAVHLRPRGNAIENKIVTPQTAAGPNQRRYTLYFGPKDEETLAAAGHDLQRGMNLGWFGAISLLLLRVLTFSHRFTGNYGIDIILLTVLVKIAFWPLTRKSFESMRAMQKVQPEMQRLREKYKDDPKQLNTEMMELYRRHKVNPIGGCLPMLLQIPVFIGLYNALMYTIELRHAPFFLWIHDLSAPERLVIFGYGIPVMTLLLGATMFLQQKMSPPAGDPAQQRVMMFMPIVFTFMFIGFPAGLTIYWLTNNVLTIAQQWFMLRSTLPTPRPA
jgi:YidC/Oxa1 family membrane protein insertase